MESNHAEMAICSFVLIIILLIFLVAAICFTKVGRMSEKFTAPGLTLTKPPSWFPQNAARPYREDDWKSRMYLERYPFKVNNAGENCQTDDTDPGSHIPSSNYISGEEADYLASAYRFWKE